MKSYFHHFCLKEKIPFEQEKFETENKSHFLKKEKKKRIWKEFLFIYFFKKETIFLGEPESVGTFEAF